MYEKPTAEPILRVRGLTKWFPIKTGFFSSLLGGERLYVKAVDGIDFEIEKGEILCLAGESGCGKTTVGRTVLRLTEPTEGSIVFDGQEISEITQREFKKYRKDMQIIFQDPYESLNPRLSVFQTVSEPLRLHDYGFSEEEIRTRVLEILELVRMVPAEELVLRFPHELSGGQRQRVAVARAMVLEPRLLIADEPVSMLDVSIRAGILNSLLDIRTKFDLSMLFITHDLAVASYMGDRLAIMYLGKLVEFGKTEDVVENPRHPYTQALISAVPSPDPTKEKRVVPVRGEPPSAVAPPPGCRFHPRCAFSEDICAQEEPPLESANGVNVACHFWEQIASGKKKLRTKG